MGKKLKGKIYGKYLDQAKYVIKGRKLKSPIATLQKKSANSNYYSSVSEINKVKISIQDNDKKAKVEAIETTVTPKEKGKADSAGKLGDEKMSDVADVKKTESNTSEVRSSEVKDSERKVSEVKSSETNVLDSKSKKEKKNRGKNKKDIAKEGKITDIDKKISELDEVLEENTPKKKYNDTRTFAIAAAILAVIIVVGIVKIGSKVYDVFNDSKGNGDKKVADSDKGLFDIYDSNAADANNQNIQSNQLDPEAEFVIDEALLKEKIENGEITKEQAEQLREDVKNGDISNVDQSLNIDGLIKKNDTNDAIGALNSGVNNNNNNTNSNSNDIIIQPGENNNNDEVNIPNDNNGGGDNGGNTTTPTTKKPNKYNVAISYSGGNNIELYRYSGSYINASKIFETTQFMDYVRSGNQILLPEEVSDGMWFIVSSSSSEVISKCAIRDGSERAVYTVELNKTYDGNTVPNGKIFAIGGTRIELDSEYYDNKDRNGDASKSYVVNGNMQLYKE